MASILLYSSEEYRNRNPSFCGITLLSFIKRQPMFPGVLYRDATWILEMRHLFGLWHKRFSSVKFHLLIPGVV
jgi:hypothetical protein